jgi:hypothetical protein
MSAHARQLYLEEERLNQLKLESGPPKLINPRWTVPPQMSKTDGFCINCQKINLDYLLGERVDRSSPPNMGKYHAFRSTLISQCNMCNLLSYLLPEEGPVNTTEDVFLLLSHSIGRQEPAAALESWSEESGSPYSVIFYIGFQREKEYELEFTCSHEAPNAISIDWMTTRKALAIKVIHQFSVNIGAVHEWITQYREIHENVCVEETDKLFHRLFDSLIATKIVASSKRGNHISITFA